MDKSCKVPFLNFRDLGLRISRTCWLYQRPQVSKQARSKKYLSCSTLDIMTVIKQLHGQKCMIQKELKCTKVTEEEAESQRGTVT